MMMIYQLKLKKYLDDSISLVSKTCPTTLKFKEENTMKNQPKWAMTPIEQLKEEFKRGTLTRYNLSEDQFAS
jgi:hypothetical protein